MKKQIDLFGNPVELKKINRIEDHWLDMPADTNEDIQQPEVILIVKFTKEKHYKEFMKKLVKHVYDNRKIFTGAIRENVRTLWYPELLSNTQADFVYIDKNIDEKENESRVRDLCHQ